MKQRLDPSRATTERLQRLRTMLEAEPETRHRGGMAMREIALAIDDLLAFRKKDAEEFAKTAARYSDMMRRAWNEVGEFP